MIGNATAHHSTQPAAKIAAQAAKVPSRHAPAYTNTASTAACATNSSAYPVIANSPSTRALREGVAATSASHAAHCASNATRSSAVSGGSGA